MEIPGIQPEAQLNFRAPRWMKAAVLTGLLFLVATPAFAESAAPITPNKPNREGNFATSAKPGTCAPFQYPIWADTGTQNGICYDFLTDSTDLGAQIGLQASAKDSSEARPETRYNIIRTPKGVQVDFSVKGSLSSYGFGVEVPKGHKVSVPSLGNSFAYYHVDFSDDEPSVSMRWTTVFPQLP